MTLVASWLNEDPTISSIAERTLQNIASSCNCINGMLLHQRILEVAIGHSSREARMAALGALVSFSQVQSLMRMLASGPEVMPFLRKVR
jgi:hypothetical protein